VSNAALESVWEMLSTWESVFEIVDESLESKSTVQLAIVVFVAAVHHRRQSPSSLSSGESLGTNLGSFVWFIP
jgi:hypothetical protein